MKKQKTKSYPWTEENIDMFEVELMSNPSRTGIAYSEKQGDIFLPPYNKVYLLLYSAFIEGLNFKEDYGNYDGACSVTLVSGGGVLLDNEGLGITVTTEAQRNELILELANIEDCKVYVYQPEEQNNTLFRIFYSCELHLNDDPILVKIAKLYQKADDIAQVLSAFGEKYPDRYN